MGCGSNCVSTGGKTGDFAGPVNYAVGTHPVAVAVADFNGDGKGRVPDANAVGNKQSRQERVASWHVPYVYCCVFSGGNPCCRIQKVYSRSDYSNALG